MNHYSNIIDNVNGFQWAFTIMAFTISLPFSFSCANPLSSLSKHSWPSLSLFLVCSRKTICFRGTLGFSPKQALKLTNSAGSTSLAAVELVELPHPPGNKGGHQGGCWVDWLLCWVILLIGLWLIPSYFKGWTLYSICLQSPMRELKNQNLNSACTKDVKFGIRKTEEVGVSLSWKINS